MKLKKRADRRHVFLMRDAEKKCMEFVQDYLGKENMRLGGCEDFEGAMQAIFRAMVMAYQRRVADTIDAEDGVERK